MGFVLCHSTNKCYHGFFFGFSEIFFIFSNQNHKPDFKWKKIQIFVLQVVTIGYHLLSYATTFHFYSSQSLSHSSQSNCFSFPSPLWQFVLWENHLCSLEFCIFQLGARRGIILWSPSVPLVLFSGISFNDRLLSSIFLCWRLCFSNQILFCFYSMGTSLSLSFSTQRIPFCSSTSSSSLLLLFNWAWVDCKKRPLCSSFFHLFVFSGQYPCLFVSISISSKSSNIHYVSTSSNLLFHTMITRNGPPFSNFSGRVFPQVKFISSPHVILLHFMHISIEMTLSSISSIVLLSNLFLYVEEISKT